MLKNTRSILLAALLASLAHGAYAADDFPPVSAEEEALDQVAGFPEAAAIMLFRNGEIDVQGTVGNSTSTILRIQQRIKVLTEKGIEDYGEVTIPHSSYLRLRNLRARTVLPDGRSVPVPDDAVFARTSSDAERSFSTSVAYPAVTAGAILDLSYEIYYDTFYFLPSWQFQNEIPTLRSEVLYHVPRYLQARAWQRDPMRNGIEHDTQKSRAGYSVRAWSRDLPPVPVEPYGFPEADIATQFQIIPTSIVGADGFLIYDTWASTCDLLEPLYYKARRKSRAAKKRAKAIRSEMRARPPEELARALYRLVRDEVRTEIEYGITVGDEGVDQVLEKGIGTPAQQALLLQTLLEEAGIDAKPVWVSDRDTGAVDPQAPNFTWFDRMIVRAMIDGQPVYLDPSHPGLPFGRLQEAYEGTTAVVYDTKKPELVALPLSAFDSNTHRAELELELSEEGQVSGSGRIEMTGHSASRRHQAPEAAADWWQEWVGERLEGFEVQEVTVQQDPDAGRVEVQFTVAQSAAEVLGDEVSLLLSRPIGPEKQRLTLPAERRQTPVLLPFANRSEVEVRLRWPETWEIDLQPADGSHRSGAGILSASTTLDPEARTLTYRRRLDVTSAHYMGREDYAAIQQLYQEAQRHDAQPLVLLRR